MDVENKGTSSNSAAHIQKGKTQAREQRITDGVIPYQSLWKMTPIKKVAVEKRTPLVVEMAYQSQTIQGHEQLSPLRRKMV